MMIFCFGNFSNQCKKRLGIKNLDNGAINVADEEYVVIDTIR